MADDPADTPASAPPPFVTAWAVDDEYRLPDDFAVPRGKGLAEVQVLRDPEGHGSASTTLDVQVPLATESPEGVVQ